MLSVKNLPFYAPVVLRFGLAIVFAWFGVSQHQDASQWVGFVPAWVLSITRMDAVTFVHVNGAFEVIAAMLLVLGVYVRVVALLLASHLFVIAGSIGLNDIGVRDFGLSCATLALGMFGDDLCCLVKMKKD